MEIEITQEFHTIPLYVSIELLEDTFSHFLKERACDACETLVIRAGHSYMWIHMQMYVTIRLR